MLHQRIIFLTSPFKTVKTLHGEPGGGPVLEIPKGHIMTTEEPSIGALYFEKGELRAAVPHLVNERARHLEQRNVRKYFDTSYMLLRTYIEMGLVKEVNRVKYELQQFIVEENVEMSSRLYYTLGFCHTLDKNLDKALTFFNQAFNVALSDSNKEDMCYALMGKAFVLHELGDTEKVRSIIENLKIFFETLTISEVEAAVGILEAQLLTAQGSYEYAKEALWQASATAKKAQSSQLMTFYVLAQFANIYIIQGKFEMAENYLHLLESQVIPGEHVRLYELVQKFVAKLGEISRTQPDIQINLVTHEVVEVARGRLEFNNQFILLELLVELVKKQGSFLTKEDMAQIIWKQPYDPSLHDNKIYVTIRRLRKILEPNPKRPHYVLRTKDGYQLNSMANVLITE